MWRSSTSPRKPALPPLASEVQQLRCLLPAPEKPSKRAQAAGRERRVQVLCRFRGPARGEENRPGALAWELGEESVASSEAGGGSAPGQAFGFDRVFGPSAGQAEIFASVAPVIQGVLRGVNGAVLCYGQTSAGKTYTMEGGQGELAGVIPRALGAIFSAAAEGANCKLTLSMLEVYMERLRDLLDPETEAELKVVEGPKGVQVCGLREVPVTSLQAALDVFHCGQRNRCVAATGMNDRSSRSHSVFMLKVEWPGGQQSPAKLYLVDLAGSECLKKACFRGEDSSAANAEIVEEAKAINQSLTTLGMVISRLADRKKAGGEQQHVPYRSSKLTRVLQDSLGGSSHTVLVVNCASAAQHAGETLSTLRFGARARSVVNVLNGGNAQEDSLLLQTLRAARLEIQRLRTGGAAAAAADAAAGNSFSMVSALTPCSEAPPSPLEVSPERRPSSRPTSRRVSRGGNCARPQLDALWEQEFSPIDGGRSPAELSPLQLTPRRSAAASLVPSRRVSRSMPFSRRVSMALSEDARDGDLSPLELSPGTSAVASRRVSRGGRLSRPRLPPSPDSTPRKEFSCLDVSHTGSFTDGTTVMTMERMREANRGRDPVLRYWEYPMTRQEKFERLLLIRSKEVDKLEQQLEGEREAHEHRQLQLEEQLAAVQTENQWLTADRMQHIEQAVRSSLAGSDQLEEQTPAAAEDDSPKEELLPSEDALLEEERERRKALELEREAALVKQQESLEELERLQTALASLREQHCSRLDDERLQREQQRLELEAARQAFQELSCKSVAEKTELKLELSRARGELFVAAEAREKALRRAEGLERRCTAVEGRGEEQAQERLARTFVERQQEVARPRRGLLSMLAVLALVLVGAMGGSLVVAS